MKSDYLKASLFALAAMVACTEYEQIDEPEGSTDNGLLQELSITGKDFQFDDMTRSSVTIGDSGASFTWDEDDVIGIFPDKGDQVSFAMKEGAGTQTATFSGGGWALKSSAKYAAYYPHVYENRDLTAIPVSYLGQTQNGNANTDHIGAYDFMAAGVSTPENGAVAFDMQHLGALVQLTITIPEPSILTKVVLTSSTEFTETGTIDLTAEPLAIKSKTESTNIEIALNKVTTAEANEIVTVYFMTAPVDLTDSDLSATIHFADETTSEVELAGKNLQAGKAYRLAAEIEETIPNNQIWYTSSDGKVVDPYIDQYFGATIKSNTYKDGKGVIEFDGDVVSIGSNAFRYCSSLTSVTIPGSVTAIAIYAFYECTALVDVIIPESVARINNFAFARCSSLKNIIIPYGVKNIEGDAFAQCSSLVNITIPESVKNIGNYAFHVCSSLAEIIIPDSVTSIGSNAFAHCESLANLTIPASVVSIGTEVIRGCVSLSSVVVEPDNKVYDSRNDCNAIIETASNTLIGGCKNSVIPDGVVEIGDDAFRNCSTLSCINIPASVTNIGDRAFSNCSSLSRIDVKATTPPTIYRYTFSGCNSDMMIYVPAGSLEAYKAADYWKSLNLIEEEIPIMAIDLGLSVKWADCNIGANKPEEVGGYYSWGEIEEKSNYDKSTYKWADFNDADRSWSMIKYCTDSEYGIIDNKTTLDLEDDVAHAKLGGSWRLPTFAEFEELLNNCTWIWITLNGVNGYKVSGNGNSIFLPAAGCRYYDETEVRHIGKAGCYWSSTLNYERCTAANGFSFFPEENYLGYDSVSRYPGASIRPVSD